MVASINTAGVAGEYNNKKGTANSDSKTLYIGFKIVFGEGVYIKKDLFLPE
jgi:hypothetical protein